MLGTALSGGQIREQPQVSVEKEVSVKPKDTVPDATMAGLVGNWG